MTEQKMVQELLDKKLEEVMAVATHELKTPLSILKAYIQLCKIKLSEGNTHSVEGIITKMDDQASKMLQLIYDIQDDFAMSSGDIHCSMINYDGIDALKQCIEAAKTTHASFTFLLDCEEHDAVVFADRDRIDQVLHNFITNAVKYADGKKVIEIKIKKQDGCLKVSVIDCGRGIAQEQRNRIFERFYRVDSSATRAKSGLGLGLFICSQIIKNHNGEIGVDNVDGRGAEFWFTLPLQN